MNPSILKDSGLEKINSILDTKLFYTKELCTDLINSSSICPKGKTILYNQTIISSLRNLNNEDKNILNEVFDNFSNCEHEAKFFFEQKKSLDSLEKDTFGQLIFQNEYLKTLNFIPFLVLSISYLKIFFVPIVSVVFPIFAYFLPYLLIKYVWKMPITYEMYTQIMGKMWNFSWDMSPQKLLQNCFTLFTLAQSMYQPIQNALHLYTIHSSIQNLGSIIYKYKSCIDDFRKVLEKNKIKFNITNSLEDLPNFNDTHRCFVEILEQPSRLFFISKDIAKLEIFWKIAENKDFEKTNLYNSESPYFKSDYIVDINLNNSLRVASSINIDVNSNHFLLSGPNGGGKSSFLRGVLQTILLSQTFGYSIGKNVHMSPFDYIFSGLHIVDNPGAQSLFEKEIIFARDVLYHNNPKLKGFVVFDEIFHSTNPPDGIKTSQRFLNKLWSFNHMCSIISTHVFDIIEESPEEIKKICVKAEKKGETLIYDYSISEGICKESSVEKIWKKEWPAV